MPALADDDLDLENLDVTGGDEDLEKDAVGRDDVEDAPIVRFVNKVLLDAIKKGASDIHFEPYEKSYRIRLRLDGYLKEIANPPVQLAVKLAARIKVMSRLDIAERRVPAGRAHQDAHLQEPRDRLPRQHLPDAVRREDRGAYSRSVERDARHRRARLRAGAERAVPAGAGAAARHDPGDRPDRQRQDRVAVHGPEHPQQGRHEHLDRGRPGGNQPAGRQPGQRQSRRSA